MAGVTLGHTSKGNAMFIYHLEYESHRAVLLCGDDVTWVQN